MKGYIYSLLMLAIAAVITGCGDNKTTSKLIGTEMVNTPPAGGSVSLGVNTTQATVFIQTIKDLFPNVFEGAVYPAFNSSSSPQKRTIFSKAFSLANKMKDSGGGGGVATVAGTFSLSVDGGVSNFSYSTIVILTPNVSGTGGSISITSTIITTYSGMTVTANSNHYAVSGTETDNEIITGTFTQGAEHEGPSSVNLTYLFTASKGSISIAGPGCTGTWSYSLTNRGTVSYLGGDEYFTAKNVTVSGLLGNVPESFTESNVNLVVPIK